MKSFMRDALAKAQRFFLEPASARPLAALRIGLALILLGQAYLVRSEILELFSSSGYVQGALSQSFQVPGTPTVLMFASWLSHLSVSEDLAIYMLGCAYVLSLLFVALGLFTRTSLVMAWFLHWTFMNSNDTTNYGADLFAQVFLFYLMLSPAGSAWSFDVHLGRIDSKPTSAARLCLRLMQFHLCIMYLASGIEKASGIQWWNGELLWRALNTPIYKQYDMSWMIDYPYLTQLGGWATLFFELGYIVFIWPRSTRRWWIMAMVGLHLGIAVFMGLGVFGVLMAMLTPALFAVSAEPQAIAIGAHLPNRFSWRDDATSAALGSEQAT